MSRVGKNPVPIPAGVTIELKGQHLKAKGKRGELQLMVHDDVSVAKDLFTVITLQGMPCGEVTSFTTKSDNDHTVVCKDGNRYHVYVNAQGRVVVEKL